MLWKETNEMNKALALATLVTTLLASGLTASTRNDADRGVEVEIKRLNTQEVQAFLNNDVKALRDIWSDDFVVTNPFNKFLIKQQVVEMIESGMLVITSYDRKIEYVRFYPDTAVVAGSETVVWGGKMPNAGKTSHLRFTAIWMKQDRRWQEIVRHANIIPEQ